MIYLIFRRFIATLLIFSILCGCSTNGGMYKKDDYQNNEFSVVNTLFAGLAVVGVVAAAMSGGGGGYYEDPKWDYIQSNGQWVCRNAVNGQFMSKDRCAYQPYIDNWPNN